MSSTAEAANPRTRTASLSHATRSVCLLLAFVVAVAAGVMRTLPTPAELALVAHQAFLRLNALVLAGIASILRRLWRETLTVEAVACAS